MMKWNYLTDTAHLEDVIDQSRTQVCLIFKHSTQCSISAIAKHRLETDWDFANGELGIFFLDLIQYRPISNQIASQFGVEHESPQLLLIKNGECIYHTSHLNINVADLHEHIGSLV